MAIIYNHNDDNSYVVTIEVFDDYLCVTIKDVYSAWMVASLIYHQSS